MKRIFLLLFNSMLAISSAVLLSNCDECGDAVKGAQLADLLVKDFSAITKYDLANNPYYQIVHTVANSILEVACPEEVDDADAHENELVMLYSADESFSNPEEIETKEVSITQPTAADQSYQMENSIEFNEDGYYSITYRLDDDAEVNERNEKNNEGEDNVAPTNGRARLYRFDRSQVFEVRNTGNTRKLTGKYVKSWDVKVKH